MVAVAALALSTAVAVPARAALQGDDEECADPTGETPVDEYGFAIDPELLVPCDELAAEAPPVDPDEPTPALVDPDPDAGRGLSEEALRDEYRSWRSTTAASLVDAYFQRLLLQSEACSTTWFERPYDGPLRVEDGTSWRAAAHTAMASVPEPEARALLYRAQAAFWEAGADCERSIERWLEITESGLDAMDDAVRRLAALG